MNPVLRLSVRNCLSWFDSCLSLLRSSVSRMVSTANRDLKRTAFRQALIENSSFRFRNNRSITHHRALLELLEPRHLMAAVPIANNDAAFYTNLSTDLVVWTSSTPAHLLANDLDIDGGYITTSLVTNPAAGTLIAFGTNGTFTNRPNTGFSGIDSFTYKTNDGSLDSNVAKVTIAIGTKLLARQNQDSNIVDFLPSPFARDAGGVGLESSNLTTGNLSLTEQLTPDQSLVYRDNSLSKPIITVETQPVPDIAVPSAITQ